MIEKISITNYRKEFHPQVVKLVTSTQKEHGILIKDEDQPDLFNIEKFCDEFWIALDEQSRVAGTIALIKIEDFAVLRKMFVSKEWRGLGLAQKLLQTFEENCLKNQINKIYLGTSSKWEAAVNFYKKSGFQLIEPEKLPEKFLLMSVDNRFFVKEI